MFVTKGTLERALDALNPLFRALEDHGHRCTSAPLDQHLRRPDVDERSKGGRDHDGDRRWAPDRAKVGLTVFERQPEIERKQHEIQHEAWRREESREHLFGIIEDWGVAKQIVGVEGAERRAAGLGGGEREAIRGRVRRARVAGGRGAWTANSAGC